LSTGAIGETRSPRIITREHLVADLDDDGVWVVGDVSRLEE
jgi:hypothetical protein